MSGTKEHNVDPLAAPLRAARKEARELRAHLHTLTGHVAQFIAWLDEEMKEPSTVVRGQRVAKGVNLLDMSNQHVRHFGLGEPLSACAKPRPVKKGKP